MDVFEEWQLFREDKGKDVLEISQEKVGEVVREIIMSPCLPHKVIINGDVVMDIRSACFDEKTFQFESINTSLGKTGKIIKIPASKIWGVDKDANLHARSDDI